LHPTSLAEGPWYKGTQHGSSMMLLAALAAETYPTDIPRQVTRLTVDMMKAAPLAPIELVTSVRKGGRYTELLDISICSAGEEYVRASALRYRVEDVPVAQRLKYNGEAPRVPAPHARPMFGNLDDRDGFHHAVEVRLDVETRPAVMWFRLLQPITPQIPGSPLLRVALAADWTYSIPNIANRVLTGEGISGQMFYGINPDTTLNLHRQPVGEWIGVQTQSTYDDLGTGTVMGQIFDEEGPVGFSTQSILIRSKSTGPMQAK